MIFKTIFNKLDNFYIITFKSLISPIDCRLILPESKFKYIEGLDSEAGFDFYNVSFSPFYGTNFLIKNVLDKLLSVFFLILCFPLIFIFSNTIMKTKARHAKSTKGFLISPKVTSVTG